MKPLSAGSEIDAWCTKCRMDLGHRIIAMVGDRPKRVICQTCGSQHNYRPPKTESSVVRRRVGGSSPKSGAPRVTQKAKAEAERLQEWEAKIAGQALNAFTRYSMDRKYEPGQLVLHKKFGEGYVTEVVGNSKINIMFRDGPRILAQSGE